MMDDGWMEKYSIKRSKLLRNVSSSLGETSTPGGETSKGRNVHKSCGDNAHYNMSNKLTAKNYALLYITILLFIPFLL